MVLFTLGVVLSYLVTIMIPILKRKLLPELSSLQVPILSTAPVFSIPDGLHVRFGLIPEAKLQYVLASTSFLKKKELVWYTEQGYTQPHTTHTNACTWSFWVMQCLTLPACTFYIKREYQNHTELMQYISVTSHPFLTQNLNLRCQHLLSLFLDLFCYPFVLLFMRYINVIVILRIVQRLIR